MAPNLVRRGLPGPSRTRVGAWSVDANPPGGHRSERVNVRPVRHGSLTDPGLALHRLRRRSCLRSAREVPGRSTQLSRKRAS